MDKMQHDYRLGYQRECHMHIHNHAFMPGSLSRFNIIPFITYAVHTSAPNISQPMTYGHVVTAAKSISMVMKLGESTHDWIIIPKRVSYMLWLDSRHLDTQSAES